MLSGLVAWLEAALGAAGEVSHVPDMDGWSSKLTCYPRVVGPAPEAVCKVERERDGVQRHPLQSGWEPKGGTVRAYTPKDLSAARRSASGGNWGGRWTQAGTSARTVRCSFSGVVWWVARRHRSTASLRAAATAHLRRAAPRAIPATSAFTGG